MEAAVPCICVVETQSKKRKSLCGLFAGIFTFTCKRTNGVKVQMKIAQSYAPPNPPSSSQTSFTSNHSSMFIKMWWNYRQKQRNQSRSCQRWKGIVSLMNGGQCRANYKYNLYCIYLLVAVSSGIWHEMSLTSRVPSFCRSLLKWTVMWSLNWLPIFYKYDETCYLCVFLWMSCLYRCIFTLVNPMSLTSKAVCNSSCVPNCL